MTDQPQILQIHVREGTLFVTDGQREDIALAVVVIAAVPPPNGQPAASMFRSTVSGNILEAAAGLARFMLQNPPFAQVVDGLREIFSHGNALGGALPPGEQPPGTLPLPPEQRRDP